MHRINDAVIWVSLLDIFNEVLMLILCSNVKSICSWQHCRAALYLRISNTWLYIFLISVSDHSDLQYSVDHQNRQTTDTDILIHRKNLVSNKIRHLWFSEQSSDLHNSQLESYASKIAPHWFRAGDLWLGVPVGLIVMAHNQWFRWCRKRNQLSWVDWET